MHSVAPQSTSSVIAFELAVFSGHIPFPLHGFCLFPQHVKDRAAKIQQNILPLSVYVHFCPFLSVYVGKIFGNLKKNPYLCTVKQHKPLIHS